MRRFPLIAPNPPKVSNHLDGFARIEASGIYSNNGPELRRFEAACTAQLFGQHGRSLGVANATLGLMIAIMEAAGEERDGRFAIVPAMTFAATGQAAWWAGLTPLIADVTPDTWELDPAAVERLIAEHGERIACVVPYAPFGAPLDLAYYARLRAAHGVGVVIDAAASLGSKDEFGMGFGADAPFALVYSMHATKTFSVGEGGLIHSGDRALIERLRAMAGFGFDGARSATMAGMNAKLPETTAVLAQAKLAAIDGVVTHRAALEDAYRAVLQGFELQRVPEAGVRATQFLPVLLPPGVDRAKVTDRLAEAGIGAGAYFSPHLGEQPWFRRHARIEPTPVADDLSRRILSLPVTDDMTAADAAEVAGRFAAACRVRRARPTPEIADTLMIGGGPAGTAVLTASAKSGTLQALCEAGLVVVERDAAIGNGRLGRYAINSDSTAQTFLTAVKDNPYPELAAIETRAEGRRVAEFQDALGVPLVDAGPLIRATGDALGGIVVRHGGQVLTRHEAVESRRTADGLWRTILKRLNDGATVERLSRNLVVATGGHQPLDRVAGEQVAGAPLSRLAGGRLMQSDAVLNLGGMTAVADLLSGKRAPRIAVIGGSTSALTTVALLLKQHRLPLGAGAISLLHRRPLRPFYHSVEAARAEGFTDFGPDDICPVSGFVYRLAGFRLEARELVLRMLEVDGRVPDPRVVRHQIRGDDEAARDIVRSADLVVAALGYRPHAHRLLDADGAAIALASERGAELVDPHCRVRDAAGNPVPGVFGIGLAAGFVPWGKLGGEASFKGQANGLWLWQNDVGQMIVDQLLDRAGAERAAA